MKHREASLGTDRVTVLDYARGAGAALSDFETSAISAPHGALSGVALAALAGTLWTGRYPGHEAYLDYLVFVLPGLFLVAVWWALRFLIAAIVTLRRRIRPQSVRRTALRWAVVPAIVGLGVVNLRMDLAEKVTFTFHRARMEQAAREVFAVGQVGSYPARRIGMYDFDTVRLNPGRFISFHATLGNCGYYFYCKEVQSADGVDYVWTTGSHD